MAKVVVVGGGVAVINITEVLHPKTASPIFEITSPLSSPIVRSETVLFVQTFELQTKQKVWTV